MEHDGTGGIDEIDVVGNGLVVGGGWFTMGTQQNISIVQCLKTFVVDGDETELSQTFHLATVVNNVAETIEGLSMLQLLFGFADSARHTEAEAGTGVNFDGHRGQG